MADEDIGLVNFEMKAERADRVAQHEGPFPAAVPINKSGLIGAAPIGDLDGRGDNLTHGEG